MEIFNELKKISAELTDLKDQLAGLKTQLAELKSQLAELENVKYFGDWIPRKKLMEFFDYGDTKIAALFKSEELRISEIGIRKFISKESVMKLLEKHVK